MVLHKAKAMIEDGCPQSMCIFQSVTVIERTTKLMSEVGVLAAT